jgi:hypothetical protein
MEIFEIHITGEEAILEAANKLGVKNITIDLLAPDRKHHRTEYMTSDVKRFANYDSCKEYVDKLVKQLGVHIIRVKIESPYYAHYKDQSCYIESHFDTENNEYPISRNQNKTTCLSTDRCYEKDSYDAFREKYEGKVVELCLFDSYVEEDFDWFAFYPRMS